MNKTISILIGVVIAIIAVFILINKVIKVLP